MIRSPLVYGQPIRGTVLIITLFMLVLLTALILAFLSNALLNRQIDYSYANMVRADQLSRSALDVVVGELRQEIADPSYSLSTNGGNSGYPLSYQPLNPTNAIAQRVGVSGTAATNIVEVSANGSAIDPGQNGRSMGSGITIDMSSQNGRFVTTDRWFGSGGPSLGTNGTMPAWVYVTRGGIQTPALASVADPMSSGYVVGRFAYTVYDQGGLMDANVAGYTNATPIAPFKSGLAFADIGGVLGINGLPAWRNGASGTDPTNFTEWAAGMNLGGATNAAAMAAAASGHLSAVAGDNAFYSRHDLLNALQNSVAGLTPAQAQYLAHFTRSMNAPSWVPGANTTTYPGNINPSLSSIRFGSNATIRHYDDNGLATTYQVTKGDPLLQRRFSLAKLAWLTSTGVKPGISAAAVQACFGLTWDSTGQNWQWDYQEAPIETLAQVATGGPSGTNPLREPNFFELLKAGIANGSLGLSAKNWTMSDSRSQAQIDSNQDLQILRIGANIIDQVTTDNFPTTVTYPVSATQSVPVYGVKDLPYLYDILATTYSQVGTSAITNLSSGTNVGVTTQFYTTNIAAVFVPELFNPNALSANPSSAGPTNLQIVVEGGTFSQIGPQGWTSGPFYRNPPSGPTFSLVSTNVFVPNYSNATDPFRYAVLPVTGNSGTGADTASLFTTQLPWLLPLPAGTPPDQYHGFVVYNYTTDPNPSHTPNDYYTVGTSGNGTNSSPNIASLGLRIPITSDILIDLKYWNPHAANGNGAYLTYDTLCGNDSYSTLGTTGLGNPGTTNNIEFDRGFPLYTQMSLNAAFRTFVDDPAGIYSKFDPRTSRAGVANGNAYATTNFSALPAMATSLVSGLFTRLPFGPGNLTSQVPYMFPGYWASGSKTNTWTTTWNNPYVANVADPDGITRPADGWLGANLFMNMPYTVPNGVFTAQGSASQYTQAAGRPIILGRPFRSVAELGYTFRDNAWKTLNFFDETSGDAALLDIFSVSDEAAVVAGKIALNSAQPAMQQALVSGVAQAYDGTAILPAATAASVGGAYQSYAYTAGVPTANLPANVGQVAAFMDSTALTNAYGYTSNTPSAFKPYRESVVRGLASGSQTRTWNFLIDVVAQVGKFPTGAAPSSLQNFVVEGEKRYWLSIALDRYTGKIVDEQLEPADD